MEGLALVEALGGGLVPFAVNGVDLWIKLLTVGDLMECRAMPGDRRVAVMVSRSVVNQAGARLLTEEQALAMPAAAVEKLATKIGEVYGLDEGKAD